MNENYTNRELDRMFQEIRDSLVRIEDQTKLTNGRVRALEKWRWFIGGGLAVIAFLFPFFNSIYSKQIEQVKDTVQSATLR